MSADTIKILERVRKLLALANDSAATAGERDNAMSAAFKTLAKYNLDMSQVTALGDNSDPRTKDGMFGEETEQWARVTANAIAKLFFCKYFSTNYGNRVKHTFVGKSVNIQTAAYMTTYANSSIAKEAEVAYKAHVSKNALSTMFGTGIAKDNSVPAGVWKLAFCKAAANTLYWRCMDMIAKASKVDEHGNGTALVLASLYQREEEANDLLMPDDLRKGRSIARSAHIESARDAGKAHGSSISLNRHVGQASGNKLLK